MTDQEQLQICLVSIKNLEKRVIQLEEQVAVCLRALRTLVEREARAADPRFTLTPKIKA